jgi:hypothetical protein
MFILDRKEGKHCHGPLASKHFQIKVKKNGIFFSNSLDLPGYPNFSVKNGITLSLIDDRPIEKFGSSSWMESGN